MLTVNISSKLYGQQSHQSIKTIEVFILAIKNFCYLFTILTMIKSYVIVFV